MNNATFLGRSLGICLLALLAVTPAMADFFPVTVVKEGGIYLPISLSTSMCFKTNAIILSY